MSFVIALEGFICDSFEGVSIEVHYSSIQSFKESNMHLGLLCSCYDYHFFDICHYRISIFLFSLQTLS